MDYTIPKQTEVIAVSFPFTLRIGKAQIAKAYERIDIAHRFSLHEMHYYKSEQWAIKPDKMITDLIIRHFSHSGLFLEVIDRYYDKLPHYELQTEIMAVEKYNDGASSSAHLAIKFRLIDFQTQKVIWTYQFDETKPIFFDQQIYLARALSDVLFEQMEIIIDNLKVFLRQATTSSEKPAPREP